MQVGFIGLGNMGAAIAGHVLSVQPQLTVWNRSADKAAELVSRGAVLAKSVEAALSGEIVFSMLADDPAIEDTLLRTAVFDRAPPGHHSRQPGHHLGRPGAAAQCLPSRAGPEIHLRPRCWDGRTLRKPAS